MSKIVSKKIASNEFLPDISGMSEEEKSKVFINFCGENMVAFTRKDGLLDNLPAEFFTQENLAKLRDLVNAYYNEKVKSAKAGIGYFSVNMVEEFRSIFLKEIEYTKKSLARHSEERDRMLSRLSKKPKSKKPVERSDGEIDSDGYEYK